MSFQSQRGAWGGCRLKGSVLPAPGWAPRTGPGLGKGEDTTSGHQVAPKAHSGMSTRVLEARVGAQGAVGDPQGLVPPTTQLCAPSTKDTRQPGAGRQAWAAAEGQPAWPPTSPLLPGPGWAGLAQPSRVWPQVCQRPCWLLAWAPCCPSPSSAGGLTRGGPHLCWDWTPLLGTEARQSLSAPAQTPLGKPAPGPVGRKLQMSRGVPPCTPLPAQPWPCCRGD